MKTARHLCVVAALVFSTILTSCAAYQAAQQRRAAQTLAVLNAMQAAWLAQSPEGTQKQWDDDRQILTTLTPLQIDAVNDAKLGVPLSPEEKKAAAALSQDQIRAVYRTAAQDVWVKNSSAQIAANIQTERALEAQEMQANAAQVQAHAAHTGPETRLCDRGAGPATDDHRLPAEPRNRRFLLQLLLSGNAVVNGREEKSIREKHWRHPATRAESVGA
jgi:hypothetical protein